jgi:hypothetical protein
MDNLFQSLFITREEDVGHQEKEVAQLEDWYGFHKVQVRFTFSG